jgi:hypothetical protein
MHHPVGEKAGENRMRKINVTEVRTATNPVAATTQEAQWASWIPVAQPLSKLDPACWSQRHQQTARWSLVAFLNNTNLNSQRNLH